MKKVYILSVIMLSYSFTSLLKAQENKIIQPDSIKSRPTVALVLSGGGAKGFAEIGTLEVIDELNIPIDYIIGTSMGSIMGGLYAIGYSGKLIADEVSKQEWNTVFTDKITSRKVPVGIKDELSRYTLSFPIKGGIKLPKGIIRGQRVMNILSKYTIGYHNTFEFSKLPIPFSCVAVDLETGEAVVFEKGSLPIALRASMSIPSVFIPQPIDDRLFIDGGVINNFPADVAKAKGYDYIIGVDVQSPLQTKEELSSATDIVNQLVSFAGKPRASKNIKLTNIYIHPDISGYSTASFSAAEVDSLIERGRKAAREAYPQLLALKEKLGNESGKKSIPTPAFETPLKFNQIQVDGLEKISKELFLRKLNLSNINSIKTDELEIIIGDVSAILDLDLLTYQLDKDTLKFTAHERANQLFNIGIHYDSDNEASLLLNTTFNNFIFKNTRASADAILGKNLQFTGRYTIKFGSIPYLNLIFDTKKYNLMRYEGDDKVAEGDFTYVKFDMNTQMILWDSYSAGIGIRKEYIDIDNGLSNSTIIPPSSNGWYTHHYAFISLNTLNNFSYPTEGLRFDAEAKYISNGQGNTGTVLYANFKKAFSLSKKFTTTLNVYGRAIIDNQLGLIYKNYWGGINNTQYLDRHIPFMGANWIQGTNNAMGVARTDFRYELFRNNYIILTGNYGRYSEDIDNFFGEVPEDIWGAGISYSYNSIIGPIDFTIMHSTAVNKPIINISIGYEF